MPGFKPLKPPAAASTKPGCQPLLLQGCCSFLAVSVPALQPALCLHSLLLLGHSSLPFARLQTPKTLRVSFHQAWPSAFAAPGLLAAKTPRGSFHQAWLSAFAAPGLLLFPGRQRSSIAACPLPAQPSLVRAFEPAVCQASNQNPPRQLPPSLAVSLCAPGLLPPSLAVSLCCSRVAALSWPSAFQHCSLPFACTAFSC